MNIKTSLKCVYYNTLSNFLILTNIFFPFYINDIYYFQGLNIECISDSMMFKKENNKYKYIYENFFDNLIEKNTDLINKLKEDEEKLHNIDNYKKLDIKQDDSLSSSDDDSNDSDNSIENEEDKKNKYEIYSEKIYNEIR